MCLTGREMDILNELDADHYGEIDDLLAFVSIYDDENRSRGYRRMLYRFRRRLNGAICVEAGCGFGVFSEYLVKRGAKKVYAIEANPHLFQLACERLKDYPQIVMVHRDIRDFQPQEPIDVLVQEFFGQLLYDEDLYALGRLQFTPKYHFPDYAVLMGGCMSSSAIADAVVSPSVLQKLRGVLVSGLFDDSDLKYQFPVVEWRPGKMQFRSVCDISRFPGDLLFFGLHIYHENHYVCRAGGCDNWSAAWTPRVSDRFELVYLPDDRGMKVRFNWL